MNAIDASVRQEKARVYIVDDDAAVRESLLWLLESVGCAAQAFGSATDFLSGINPDLPGCLILDVRMPSIGGFELHNMVRERAPALSTIFITAHGDVPMSVRAMKAGAFDFLEKPFNYQAMIDTVQMGVGRSCELLETQRQKRGMEEKLNLLSPRENEVLKRMTEGLLTKQIAFELGLSIKTVEVHRASIKRKLQIDSIARIVAMMTQAGAPLH